MKFNSVVESGASQGDNGFKVKASYDVEISDELLADLAKSNSIATAIIPIRWVVNDTETTEDGYAEVSAGYDYELNKPYAIGEVWDFKKAEPGTYRVKAYLPETVEFDVKFCVYQYNPEEDYYTDLIGCYDSYEAANNEASTRDAIVSTDAENATAHGEVEIDMGVITIGGRKAPPPEKKEPIWYPGKFLKKIIGG